MPGIDSCQAAIIRALRKDGFWVKSSQKYLAYPIIMRSEASGIYIDIEIINITATRTPRLYVEVKCLSLDSDNKDFYAAVGQYLSYQAILAEIDQGVPLYLAMPHQTYEMLSDAIRRMFGELGIKLILVDLTTERVIQWIV